MDIKKLILTGSCAAALSMVAACGDDSPSAPSDPVVTSSDASGILASSGSVGISSAAVATSSAGVTTSSTSNVLLSSSSLSNTDDPQMACSEIMYNAADGSSLEWVEIYIAGGSDMDNMQDYELHLSGAVDYTFPAGPLAKGEYVVVTNDLAAFAAAYPTFAGRVFGPFSGKLANEGDVVNVKVRGEGDVSCAFSSEPPWPSLADGKGRSLVYTGGIAAQAKSWCASAVKDGAPGVGNDACIDANNSVRINEIKPYASEEDYSWIELYNSGTVDVDVSGWTLTVKRNGKKLAVAAGSVVPAGGYLVLDGKTGFDKELVVSNQGGEFYLNGLVEGQESSIWVPASNNTTGVVDLEDGSTAQGPMAVATKGTANSALLLGSVYINEIYYHPSETSFPYEFLEIVNGTEAPVTLYTASVNGIPVNKGWKVEGINIEFGATDVLPAKGMALLLPDSVKGFEASIRATYGIAESVKIAYYAGKLSNRGETIAIKEPVAKEGTGVDVKYFYTWHDATLYSDAWAGLVEADGFGYSLQRAEFTTMGYNPSSWTAAVPTPGL